MKSLSKDALQAIKVRFDNHFNKEHVLWQDFEDLKQNFIFILKENSFLKEKLFDIENVLPEDKKWQNILATKLELAFLENDAKEFLEINDSINNRTYTIIIQKKFGKTPKQSLLISDARRLKVLKKNIALRNHIKELEASCAKYKQEISAYNQIMVKHSFSSEEERNFSYDKINAAMAIVKNLIFRFNNSNMKFELKKMHKSYSSAFQENWSRMIDAESEVKRLTLENKKLKRNVLQKKYPFCRIYKGRLKRG